MGKVFYDTEFLEDGETIDLLSIGLVNEEGETYYAVVSDADWSSVLGHPWLMDNVVPHLPVYRGKSKLTPWLVEELRMNELHPQVKSRATIAGEVAEFLIGNGQEPELWAYFSAYDHVALTQLWGPASRRPPGVPLRTNDLAQLWESVGRPELPPQRGKAHNALDDALWNVEVYATCEQARAK